MTTPPDTRGTPQPPTDGVKEYLCFVALTVATYILGASIIILVFFVAARGAGHAGRGTSAAALWNKFCASVATQNDALRALNDSLHASHPDRVVAGDRLELYTRAIVESERQTALLKAMRKAEFGVAGQRGPEALGPEKLVAAHAFSR